MPHTSGLSGSTAWKRNVRVVFFWRIKEGRGNSNSPPWVVTIGFSVLLKILAPSTGFPSVPKTRPLKTKRGFTSKTRSARSCPATNVILFTDSVSEPFFILACTMNLPGATRPSNVPSGFTFNVIKLRGVFIALSVIFPPPMDSFVSAFTNLPAIRTPFLAIRSCPVILPACVTSTVLGVIASSVKDAVWIAYLPGAKLFIEKAPFLSVSTQSGMVSIFNEVVFWGIAITGTFATGFPVPSCVIFPSRIAPCCSLMRMSFVPTASVPSGFGSPAIPIAKSG